MRKVIVGLGLIVGALILPVSGPGPAPAARGEPTPIPAGGALLDIDRRRLPTAPPPAAQGRDDEETRSNLADQRGSLPRRPGPGPLTGWPAAGPISQAFGCSVYYTGQAGPDCPAAAPWFHDGLDIAAGPGQPVRAALTGTVLFAGPDGSGPICRDGYRGYGLGVVIDSGTGWQALYAHLGRIAVAAGQAVMPQTTIGTVGATGCVSGPHLHFGLRRRGTLVDPEQYLKE